MACASCWNSTKIVPEQHNTVTQLQPQHKEAALKRIQNISIKSRNLRCPTRASSRGDCSPSPSPRRCPHHSKTRNDCSVILGALLFGFPCGEPVVQPTRHTSHVTHHTSHITHHTSHVTRNNAAVTAGALTTLPLHPPDPPPEAPSEAFNTRNRL